MQEKRVIQPQFQMEALVGPFTSIAIIGNSPKLVEAEHGAQIDAHDVVVRINDGRTVGFEKHTGARTSLRYVGVPIKQRYKAFFADLKENAPIATRADNGPVLDDLGWQGDLILIDRYSWIMRNAFQRLETIIPLTNIPAKNPRTGIMLLSMLTGAMQAGHRISLYGFEVAERRGGAEHFYSDGRKFDDAMASWDEYHCPLSYEFDTIIALRDRGLVNVR